MFEIEEGIEIPPRKRSQKNSPIRLTADKLSIGQTFFVPTNEENQKIVRSVAGSLNNALKPKRFITRSVKGGKRIWRTE